MDVALHGPLYDAIKGAFEGTPEGALINLYEDVHEGTFDGSLEGGLLIAIEDALERSSEGTSKCALRDVDR